MSSLAVPIRQGEIQLDGVQLEQHGDHLCLRFKAQDGRMFVFPASDETARELGRALMAATDRVLIARV